MEKKSKFIMFNPNAWRTFQHLKNIFTSVPVLKLSDPEREFLVEVNALEVGIRVITVTAPVHPQETLSMCLFLKQTLASGVEL